MLHLTRPPQKAPQIRAFPPGEFPEFEETNLGHFDARIRFNAPQQVRAAPRGEVVALGGVPEEPQDLTHSAALV